MSRDTQCYVLRITIPPIKNLTDWPLLLSPEILITFMNLLAIKDVITSSIFIYLALEC